MTEVMCVALLRLRLSTLWILDLVDSNVVPWFQRTYPLFAWAMYYRLCGGIDFDLIHFLASLLMHFPTLGADREALGHLYPTFALA